MTILTLNKKELEEKIGKLDESVKDKITLFGTPVEDENNDELMVEVFPNRPDLLSLQGFARAFNAYCGKDVKNSYEVTSSGDELIVDGSVPEQWPFVLACVVKGIKFDDRKIKDIIDVQEKLGNSILRKRKKGGIGIYPLDKIKFPVNFKGMKPEEIKFRPLEFPREITGRQILSQHPTGREYGDICKDWEKFPFFIDADGKIMSMPPIINSHDVGKIDNTTTDLFVETAGNNMAALKNAMNIIVTALADMGGKIYSLDCVYPDGKKHVVPDLNPEKIKLDVDYINKNLGLELKKEEVVKLLEKMGHQIDGDDVLVPPYRTDMLHEIDLVEEVAIAYGYDNFEPEIPDISTIGGEDKMGILKRKVGEVLVGLGLTEISTYHLSTKEKQFKNIGVKNFLDKMIEVLDSKTENNILRNSLFANSINILSENSDASYPQKIFEVGKVFHNSEESETGILESERLSVSLCYEGANFTDLKQVLDYLMRMFDLQYEIEETEADGFIDGRCGKIIVDGNDMGVIGEVSPFVLRNGKIKMPVASMELDIGKLY